MWLLLLYVVDLWCLWSLAHIFLATIGMTFYSGFFFPLLPCSLERILAFHSIENFSTSACFLLILALLDQDECRMVSPSDSASRNLISVALYAPVIALKYLFCSIVGFATDVIPLSRLSFDESHTGEAYVIAGRITEVYTCQALLSVVPHVEAATLVRASVYLVILAWTSLIWGSHRIIYIFIWDRKHFCEEIKPLSSTNRKSHIWRKKKTPRFPPPPQ